MSNPDELYYVWAPDSDVMSSLSARTCLARRARVRETAEPSPGSSVRGVHPDVVQQRDALEPRLSADAADRRRELWLAEATTQRLPKVLGRPRNRRRTSRIKGRSHRASAIAMQETSIVHEQIAPAATEHARDLGEKPLSIRQVVSERESVDEVDGPVTQREVKSIDCCEHYWVAKTEIEPRPNARKPTGEKI